MAKFNKFSTESIVKAFGLNAIKPIFYNFPPEEIEEEQEQRTSYLGTPVFSNIEFIPSSFIDKNGNEIPFGNILKNNGTGDAFKIDTVLFDVSLPKNIVKTSIQGLNGTVKEYISLDDYQINIKGAIVSENSANYPTLQVQQFREYMEAETTLQIASRLLNDVFNITDMVVESVNYPSSRGVQNLQLFEIQAVSDVPKELNIIRNE